MIDFGTVLPGTTLYIPFATYDSNDPTASVTMTGLAVTDIEIYKDGSTTQRGSDNGYALLDTDGIDFDGITGIHGLSVDLADNSTAGFYAAGSQYWVAVSSVTVDAGTINFIAAAFRIGYPDAILNTTIATLASQTSFTLTVGPADNNALVGCIALIHDVASAVQIALGVVSAYTGSSKTVTLAADPGVFTMAATDNISFFRPVNTKWLSPDVITSDAFDESTAFPLKSADTGATYVARAPSGTQTLDSLASQISGIGSGTGAALNFQAVEDNASAPIKTVSSVGTQTGTYANTLADDGTTHQIASVANAFDWIYGFNVGAARSASKVVMRNNMSATGDTCTVQAYNFVTPGWDTRTTITGTAETLRDIPLLAAHTGTGADQGKVYIRFTFSEADAGTLVNDELYVQAQQSGSLVGYSDGAVWLNTGASNTNTVPYVDGVADNPVSTIAAALTIAAAQKLKRIRVANGSSVTLGAAVESYSLIGKNWTLAMGGQSISGSYIEGATVTGTGTGASPPTFVDCHVVGASAAPTFPPSIFYRCGIDTTATYKLTAGSAGQFLFVDCFSEVAGSGTPHFVFSGANGVNIRRWSGGTNITLDNSGTALSIEVVTGGGQTIDVGGADVEIRGICRAITLTGITSDTKAQIDCVTGPISLAGADGEVNIYGVCGVVTDSRTGTPTGAIEAINRLLVNQEMGAALSTYDAPTNDTLSDAVDAVNVARVNNVQVVGSGTALDPWGPDPNQGEA
jgi:hypothetical protein